jgi:subtilisin family serine protease
MIRSDLSARPCGRTALWLSVLILLLAAAAPARAADPGAPSGGKIPITKLSDLPPHAYPIQGKASEVIENPEAVLDLAGAMEKDIEADLAKYDIQDKTTLSRYHGWLLSIAMLRKDWARARAEIETIRSLQDKPAEKLTAGIVAGALIAAGEAPADKAQEALRSSLDQSLAALPYDQVQDELKQTKARAEIISRNIVVGGIASAIDTVAATGSLSQNFAGSVLGAAYMLQYFVPNKDQIAAAYNAVLDAHKTAAKQDIWAARAVSLQGDADAKPVNVGIWDSGVDVSVYPKQLWVNGKEIPGNGKDDDKDGFVDDVNGIAWTLHSDPTTSLLIPADDLGPNADQYKDYLKGFEDLQANLDTPDAGAVKKKLASLTPDQFKPFIEGLNHYAEYAHGTHVAGIAVDGNPAARIVAARITFDYHMIPEKPTIEQAKKDAAAMVKTIGYFRDRDVRVVNMSWGGDLQSIDRALEQNRAGGTPQERRALARKIYDIQYKAFGDALKKTPDVLFVVAAGNENNDVKFDEVFPSSFRGPNVLVVGAVDQAGDQTSFTSFGNCDVYASGFEVESYIPGGERVKFSGTSMAAPQATNLAGKLWALHPNLKASDVRDLIVKGADETQAGDKTIRLLNPKKTVSLASAP